MGIERAAGNLFYRDPKHWRERAACARVVAEKIVDPQSKRLILEIAYGYEKLARRAEIRA